MSEPARSLPPHESSGRPAPGPLRDWLSAMKTHSPAETPRSNAKAVNGAADSAWSPRVVAPAEPSQAAESEDADISELMAENLMLKAKLRLEAERQDELQAILAEEIRTLRAHIQDEIGSLDELRAEQAEIRAERERFKTERAAMLAERERAAAERSALESERDALREERDLWRARTEALAQPLFQMQKR